LLPCHCLRLPRQQIAASIPPRARGQPSGRMMGSDQVLEERPRFTIEDLAP
jgi:hypothetical protein